MDQNLYCPTSSPKSLSSFVDNFPKAGKLVQKMEAPENQSLHMHNYDTTILWQDKREAIDESEIEITNYTVV